MAIRESYDYRQLKLNEFFCAESTRQVSLRILW